MVKRPSLKQAQAKVLGQLVEPPETVERLLRKLCDGVPAEYLTPKLMSFEGRTVADLCEHLARKTAPYIAGAWDGSKKPDLDAYDRSW